MILNFSLIKYICPQALFILFYTLTFFITTAIPDIPEFKNEQIHTIGDGFQQFLEKVKDSDWKSLSGGLSSNKQYLCILNDKKYVIRILKKSKIQQKTEIAAHFAAMCENIAPVIHYHYSNDSYSVIVMDFINDHTLWVQQANHKEVLNQVADKVRSITQFDVNMLTDQTPKNLFEKISKYYKKLKKLELKTLESMLDQALEIVEIIHQRLNKDNFIVFSHGDLNSRNIFFTNNQFMLIDWENACLHYDLHDVASYSVFLCLTQSDDVYLLTRYLQHTPSPKELQRFQDIKLMIRAINVFNLLSFLQHIPNSISIESIREFKYYETIFAQDSEQNSDEFLFVLAVSQLKEFFKEYEESN